MGGTPPHPPPPIPLAPFTSTCLDECNSPDVSDLFQCDGNITVSSVEMCNEYECQPIKTVITNNRPI